jgi:hypothetical protein
MQTRSIQTYYYKTKRKTTITKMQFNIISKTMYLQDIRTSI